MRVARVRAKGHFGVHHPGFWVNRHRWAPFHDGILQLYYVRSPGNSEPGERRGEVTGSGFHGELAASHSAAIADRNLAVGVETGQHGGQLRWRRNRVHGDAPAPSPPRSGLNLYRESPWIVPPNVVCLLLPEALLHPLGPVTAAHRAGAPASPAEVVAPPVAGPAADRADRKAGLVGHEVVFLSCP